MPAARLALINTMEPVFAALFGYWLAGDRLAPPQFLGGLLILSAVIAGAGAPALAQGRGRSRESVPPARDGRLYHVIDRDR